MGSENQLFISISPTVKLFACILYIVVSILKVPLIQLLNDCHLHVIWSTDPNVHAAILECCVCWLNEHRTMTGSSSADNMGPMTIGNVTTSLCELDKYDNMS